MKKSSSLPFKVLIGILLSVISVFYHCISDYLYEASFTTFVVICVVLAYDWFYFGLYLAGFTKLRDEAPNSESPQPSK